MNDYYNIKHISLTSLTYAFTLERYIQGHILWRVTYILWHWHNARTVVTGFAKQKVQFMNIHLYSWWLICCFWMHDNIWWDSSHLYRCVQSIYFGIFCLRHKEKLRVSGWYLSCAGFSLAIPAVHERQFRDCVRPHVPERHVIFYG